jgi:DNA-binding Lrp family transcriptional regulator
MLRTIRKTGTFVSKKIRGFKSDDTFTITEVDRKILRALSSDSRLSLRNIASETRLSVGTVREHLGELQRHNVIKGYTVMLDPVKLGYKITGIVQIFVENKIGIGGVESKIATMPGVMAVYSVTGGSDMIVIARFSDASELNVFVKEILTIKGVLRTSTLIVLDTFKEDFRVVV